MSEPCFCGRCGGNHDRWLEETSFFLYTPEAGHTALVEVGISPEEESEKVMITKLAFHVRDLQQEVQELREELLRGEHSRP